MNNKVKFLRGTSGEYAAAEKDSDAIYFTTDDGKLYIGDKEVSGGGSITIDNALSDTSENSVQNKVINSALNNKADKSKYGDTTINVGRRAGTLVGDYSTAEGFSTEAGGRASHAEGAGTSANGQYSHAEGLNTTARGSYSHAEGYYTTTTNESEHASGKYNQSNSDTLFSVGDGAADDARHNAFEITTTGGKLHDKDIATTDLIPTSLPANGGNADTLNGMSAETIRSMSKNVESGTSATSLPLADGTYCGIWADVPSYLSDTQGTLIVSNYHTNGAPSPWSHRIFFSPHYNTIWHGFISNHNWYGWKEISTTPIKKISFPSVATNAGGGGSLFLADFGTPITIACTSRADTQCTPFLADIDSGKLWLVLAKDTVTLDSIPAGSYSFDVWYI